MSFDPTGQRFSRRTVGRLGRSQGDGGPQFPRALPWAERTVGPSAQQSAENTRNRGRLRSHLSRLLSLSCCSSCFGSQEYSWDPASSERR